MTTFKQDSPRRTEILQVIASLLEAPVQEKITTATLAKKLNLSEAALYRHFASKSQMFDALIEFIDQSIMTVTNNISTQESQGLRQTELIVAALLGFAHKNRGLTRILIGEALVHENPRLHKAMQQLLDRLASALKQSLKVAAVQKQFPNDARQAGLCASLLMSYVLGRWHLFVRSGFAQAPLDGWSEHWHMLMRGFQSVP